RPAALDMKVWTHSLLGRGSERREQGRIVREWRLDDRAPRRIEEGVPPLEARVGVSFGTRDWPLLARALGDRFRSLDAADPYIRKWVRDTLGKDKSPLSLEQQVARIVAAVGKTVARGEAFALGDEAASMSGGEQRET